MFASARANDTPSLLLFRCVGQLKDTMVAMARHVAVVVGMTMFASARANDAADYSKFMAPGASTKPVRGGRPKDFGFLKDLGLEKPSWLPDFGGSDDKPAEEPKAEEEEASEEEVADSEEKQAAEFATNSKNPISLSAIGIGLLSFVTMLVVHWRRGLQPATALGENLMEMKSQDSNVKMNSGRAGWGQLSSQSARPLTPCDASKQEM